MTTPLTVYAELLHNVIQDKERIGVRGLKHLVNQIYRMSSQIQSQQVEHFHSGSAGSCIRTAKFWSKGAVELWNSLEGSDNKRAGGKSANGKTLWSVEHQYPIGIFVKLALDGKMNTVELIEEHLEKFNKYIIITEEENRRLPKTVKTLEEGDRRYSDANIEIVEFSTK